KRQHARLFKGRTCRDIDSIAFDAQSAGAWLRDESVGRTRPAKRHVPRVETDVAASGIGRSNDVGQRYSRSINRNTVKTGHPDIAAEGDGAWDKSSRPEAAIIALELAGRQSQIRYSRASQQIGGNDHT